MISSVVPEQGQLVEVRRRQYVVTEVVRGTLPPSPLALSPHAPQHLVSLTSIEDDALGEELRVIWELEPGAQIRERSTLPQPTGFDAPRRLDAFLDAVRWGATSSADVRALLAPFRSGIDLQNYCHRLIHFEIPWNPNRLEQRNGRVDRHGQQHDVEIYHFVAKGYRAASEQPVAASSLEADLEFLMRAALKIEQIREDLGKVGPVIAEQVEEAMLGKHVRLDTDQAERNAEPVRRLLKFERDLREQIAKHYEQLLESRQSLHLTPENIQTVVEVALQLAGQPPLQRAHVEGVPEGKAFRLPHLSGSWALCAEGLAHPHTGEVRPIVFDHEVARGRDDVVLAHLNHRLVQMSLRLLRAEVWSREGNNALHRVTARVVPNQVLDVPVVVAHARLVVTGGDSHRLHEEIITAGGFIREGRFRRMGVQETQAKLDAALPDEPSKTMKQQLTQVWPSISEPLIQALDARLGDRTASLQKLLDDRATKEIADITAVMTELKQSIEKELQEPEYIQLELFSLEERDQLKVNMDALRLRHAQIPGELEKELAAIRARFANPTPRLFPVAVTFLVPSKLA